MITTVINVTVSKITENCHVKINPICQSKSGNACLNVELGNPVEFEMEVTLKSCKEEIIKVKPVGMNEELIIEVEPLCTCPCSTQDVVQDDILPQRVGVVLHDVREPVRMLGRSKAGADAPPFMAMSRSLVCSISSLVIAFHDTESSSVVSV